MPGLSMRDAARAALDRLSPDKIGSLRPSPFARFDERFAYRFFLACAALLVAIEIFLTLGPALARDVPVELDDSLTYLLRGAQMVECPRQDCPALEDLRRELGTPPADPAIAGAVQEAYLHMFLNHVPGYSIAIALLKKLGLGYIGAYHALTVLGGIALALGASVWAYAMAGPVAGGIAILLFGTTYFVGHGLVWLVPSNMTLGFAMLALGLVTLRPARHRGILLVLIALILSWHSIGKFYACAIVCACAALVPRPWRRQDFVFLAAGAALIAGFEALTHMVERPMLKMPLVPLPYEGTALDVIRGNLMEIPRVVGRSAVMTLGLAGLVMITVLAPLLMPRQRRRPYLLFLGGFGALLSLSVFHLSPRIPAEIFARFWVPMALVLACGYASVLISAARNAPALLAELVAAARKGTSVSEASAWRAMPALLLTAALVCGMLTHLAVGAFAIVRAERMVAARHDYTYVAGSARMAREPDGACGRIYYARKEVMLAHFLDGALDCRVYLNVSGVKDLGGDAFKDVRRVAFFNPVRELKGWIDLDKSWAVEVAFDTMPAGPVHVLLRGTGEAALSVAGTDGKIVQRETIRANVNGGWQAVSTSGWKAGSRIALTTTSGRIQLGGLRLHKPDDGNRVRWPWGEGVRLKFQANVPYQDRPASDVVFDPSAWAAVTGRKLNVIDDRGFAVLATLD